MTGTRCRAMNGKEVPYSARVAAANALLDRGYGKPAQAPKEPNTKTIEGIVIEPFRKSRNRHCRQ
jgi:hypothetical protein